MTTDQVLKGLDCIKKGDKCNEKCPYFGCGGDCRSRLAIDALKLVDDQSDLIDELNCWNKLLWRFIHSDDEIECAFYKFYNIRRTHE